MNYFKKALTAVSIGLVAILMSGCISFGTKLDDKAMGAYLDMWENVNKYGDPARAMGKRYKVDKGISNEDIAESIYAVAEDFNMRIVGDIKMFTMKNARGKEIKHVRNFSMCSLSIAKQFLKYSHYFGIFMPCRVMLIELANGDKYLYTMDLTLAIHGGYPLPPEMLKLAKHVQKAMIVIPRKASKGDF